jgi:uncharacterized protein involved in exopolysaccharide biosynthesis
MNIVQFLRILWARRFLVVIAFAASALGAFVVTQLVEPRYEAVARINIDLLKQDPMSGASQDLRSIGVYFDAQQQLVHDYAVTGFVVDKLGWLTDPTWLSAYQHRPASDTRNFRLWLGEQVSSRTTTAITGSSVLEISFRSSNPIEAKTGAEALREAFLSASLASKQQSSSQLAAWYTRQSDLARQAADEAELKKAAYEKETGIVMQSNDMDIDSGRLAALAGQMSMPSAGAAMATSSARLQLAQLDAQIAQQSKNLGPNHPEMQALREQRASVAEVVKQEEADANRAASGVSGAQVLGRVLEAEKARVIGQRDKVEKLRQLQSEVDLRRDQYRKTAARAAEITLRGSLTDLGMTAMGVVVAPSKPVFPNKPLMVGGAAALGAGAGLGLALLLELLNRRVRGIEDLNVSSDLKCIGVVLTPRRRIGWFRRIFGLPARSGRPAAA